MPNTVKALKNSNNQLQITNRELRRKEAQRIILIKHKLGNKNQIFNEICRKDIYLIEEYARD